jgi:hypothetical protein
VLLIGKATETSNPGSSLLEYLEALAVIGKMAFFSRWRSIANQLSPDCEHTEPEEMIGGLSN